VTEGQETILCLFPRTLKRTFPDRLSEAVREGLFSALKGPDRLAQGNALGNESMKN
jgi:hypothetical protein